METIGAVSNQNYVNCQEENCDQIIPLDFLIMQNHNIY